MTSDMCLLFASLAGASRADPFTRSEGRYERQADWLLTSLIRSMVGCRFQSE